MARLVAIGLAEVTRTVTDVSLSSAGAKAVALPALASLLSQYV
jgi:hypothetical protein